MTVNDIDDKLYTVKTNPDTESHLKPNFESCKKCRARACLYVCPADVYSWNEKENIPTVKYENCLECGACRVACEAGTLDWKYPKERCGITFKQG